MPYPNSTSTHSLAFAPGDPLYNASSPSDYSDFINMDWSSFNIDDCLSSFAEPPPSGCTNNLGLTFDTDPIAGYLSSLVPSPETSYPLAILPLQDEFTASGSDAPSGDSSWFTSFVQQDFLFPPSLMTSETSTGIESPDTCSLETGLLTPTWSAPASPASVSPRSSDSGDISGDTPSAQVLLKDLPLEDELEGEQLASGSYLKPKGDTRQKNRAIPSSSQASKTSRAKRASRSLRPSTAASSPSPPSSPRTTYARRAIQLTCPYKPLSTPEEKSETFECPACKMILSSSRMSDVRRHYATHYGPRFICNGVHIDRASEYGITDLSEAREVNGELRVGRFCSADLSRPDSLRRHLRNSNCRCVTDVLPYEYYREIGRL